MKFRKISIFILILTLSACGEPLPEVKAIIKSDKLVRMPLTDKEVAYGTIMVTVGYRGLRTNKSPYDKTRVYFLLPEGAKAEVEGKTYFLSQKIKYKTFLGKKMRVALSHNPGYPEKTRKGKLQKITLKKDADLIKKFKGTDKLFDEDINVFLNSEKDKHLRTYQIIRFTITENYLLPGDTVIFKGEIKGDTLFLF